MIDRDIQSYSIECKHKIGKYHSCQQGKYQNYTQITEQP